MGKNRKKTQPTGKEEDDEKWAPSITKPVTEDFDAGSEATSKESSSPGVVGPPEILFPPHCTSSEGPARRTRVHSFVLTLHVDLVFLLLLALSLVTRLYRLDYPRNIVFDELHFGKYAQLYNKGVFFFDFQPPLGKQLIALASHLAGFDAGASNFTYSKIGQAYSAEIPVVAMRLIPAVCGSLLPPLMYLVSTSLGFCSLSSFVAGLLILMDNSLLCQSRFILMEPILLCLMLLGFLCLLKFRQRPLFSPSYWGLLLSSAFFLACAFSVKYVAYFSLLCAWYVILRDLWDLIPDQKLSYRTLMAHTIACALAFSVIPLAVYIASFYVHLSTLTKAGHHDSVMTSHFQASLEGGLASLIRNQPLEVVHGSQITLRHSHGKPCWLHSHEDVYPLRYPDGRGSSHQQQVTCYSFKDVNNWWIVKKPQRNDLVVSEPKEVIKHGDIVQLVHGLSSRALNSHDVAAPMSPALQEVSCYIDYNISMPSQNLWRVEILNRDKVGSDWHAIESQVRLVHVNSTQALLVTGKQLPDWGYNQYEVATDRELQKVDTVWNVEEHRYTKNQAQKDRERELIHQEFIPTHKTHLSFLEKFLELQIKMLLSSSEGLSQHMYMSQPLEWPFLTRGIAYWVSSTSNAQIHLLGNPAIWSSGVWAVGMYLGVYILYLLRRQRHCFDVNPETWHDFTWTGQFLLAGYLLHWLPYIQLDRVQFIHFYLPALLFKILLIAALLEHLVQLASERLPKSFSLLSNFLMASLLITWLGAVVYNFVYFLPFSYGITALSPAEIQAREWKESWGFIIHKR